MYCDKNMREITTQVAENVYKIHIGVLELHSISLT
jgi:hypothetical protein